MNVSNLPPLRPKDIASIIGVGAAAVAVLGGGGVAGYKLNDAMREGDTTNRTPKEIRQQASAGAYGIAMGTFAVGATTMFFGGLRFGTHVGLPAAIVGAAGLGAAGGVVASNIHDWSINP